MLVLLLLVVLVLVLVVLLVLVLLVLVVLVVLVLLGGPLVVAASGRPTGHKPRASQCGRCRRPRRRAQRRGQLPPASCLAASAAEESR